MIEYRIIHLQGVLGFLGNDHEATLNRCAQEGWEVVSVTTYQLPNYCTAVLLKRSISQIFNG